MKFIKIRLTQQKSKYGSYKEYHTSLDDFKFVTKKGLTGGFNVAKQAIINLDNNCRTAFLPM